jgi:cytochrome c oxidase subunit 2
MPALDGLLVPVTASDYAAEVNWLTLGLVLVTGAILALVFGLMLVFCVRYRRGSTAERGNLIRKSWTVEVGWTTATFLVFVGLFFWGGDLYLRAHQPPSDAEDITVVAKQWMWKAEHAGGQREIDALHVPVGQPVRLVMTSQDVIHSFFVPAFRVKQDVLPGRYTQMWFTPTKAGEYHLLCAEFCGAEHADMRGSIVAMEPADYQRWLVAQGAGATMAQQGGALFRQYGCSGCHGAASTVHAPPLEGLYGRPVPLEDGRVVTADDRYIRDSILLPKSEIAAGYPPIMPSFAGQIGEEDLLKLIAYIKSLGTAERPPR